MYPEIINGEKKCNRKMSNGAPECRPGLLASLTLFIGDIYYAAILNNVPF